MRFARLRRRSARAVCSPAGRRARRPAVPGWSNAALSRSLSARSPTWSRAVTAAGGSDQVRAGAALLGGDDRPQHPVDRRVQRGDDRVVLVEPGAVDLDDQLGARLVERVALQLLDRVAEHLAVEVPRRRGGPRSPRASSHARRARSGSPARRGASRARTPATAAPWRGARRSSPSRSERPGPRRRTARAARGRAPAPGR